VPDSHWIYLPVLAGTFGNVVFVYAVPSVAYRVAVATVCWVAIIGGAVATLLRHRDRDRSISARVLTGIFILLAALMLARGVYYVVAGQVVVSIAQPLNWVNALTPLLVAVLPVIGTTAFVLLCFERIRAELHRAATTDALTGLPNRRTITERASVLLALAHAGQQPFSVAVIDVDYFKAINDQHGHNIGDLVLQAVAANLRAHCRGEEVVGRQGGEEFVALLPEADAAGAHRAAERLRTAVADQSIAVGPDTSLQVTVSIGIATGTSNSLPDFDTLLKRADMALYDAKANGRNRVCAAS